MKVYISGPITGTDDYLDRFTKAQREIESWGQDVINPAPLGSILPEKASHEDFMHICYALLDLADCIYMMTGWESSKGAKMEMEYAINRKISICFET